MTCLPSSGRGRRAWICPRAPQRTAKEKTSPLWVLTPPVAENICSSARFPAKRSLENKRGSGSEAWSQPIQKKSRNHGIKAALLSRKVKKSISWWEPELFRSTSPGFGVADTSYKRARTAQAAAKSAAFPRKKSFKICTVRQRMSSVEWALFSIQEAAGSPQTRQEREPRPKSPREMGFPSGEKTSILNRRPSG